MTVQATETRVQFDHFTVRLDQGENECPTLQTEPGASHSSILFGTNSLVIKVDYAHRPVFVIKNGNTVAITNDRRVVQSATQGLAPDIDLLRYFVEHGSAMKTNVPFRGVDCVAPGSQITVSDGQIFVDNYQTEPPGEPITERDDVEKALVNSIKSRIQDKSYAFALSGGVDSTLLATLAHKHELCEVTAYTGKTGFGSDLHFARLAAKSLGIKLIEVEIPVTSAQLAIHRSITEAASGPITIQGNSIGFASLCMAAQKDGFYGIVDGTGSEHIFGGNQSVHGLHWAAEQLRLDRDERVKEFIDFNLSNSLITRRTVSEINDLAKEPLSFKKFMFDDLTSGRVRKFENHQNAIASMLGFDVVTPYIDHEVGRYLLNDSSVYFQGGWNKSILREIMAKYLPQEVAYRVDNQPLRWPTANLIKALGPEMRSVLRRSGILRHLPISQRAAILLHSENLELWLRPLLKISRRLFSQAYAAGVFLETCDRSE